MSYFYPKLLERLFPQSRHVLSWLAVNTEEKKRLFFGFELEAPWPDKLPKGRIIKKQHRHLTFVYIGDANPNRLLEMIGDFPPFPFKVAPAGVFDECLFFARALAWHIDFMNQQSAFLKFQKQCSEWLLIHGFGKEKKPYTPHVTLARKPFDVNAWKKAFTPLPILCTGIHLYESLGFSRYASLYSKALPKAFEEMEHTADVAFLVRAESYHELHKNARLALAMHFPPLLEFFSSPFSDHIDDIIIDLNASVTHADSEIGCPLKAVSFHGDLTEKNGVLTWEMIVDV